MLKNCYYQEDKIMDKEIILSLNNALKTLKDIFVRQDELILTQLMTFYEMEKQRAEIFHNRLAKITNEIGTLMKNTFSKDEYISHLIESNKLFKEILEKEQNLTNQIESVNKDLQLKSKDLKDKIIDFDYILDEIAEKLK